MGSERKCPIWKSAKLLEIRFDTNVLYIHIFVTIKLKLANITISLNLKSRVDLMKKLLELEIFFLKK